MAFASLEDQMRTSPQHHLQKPRGSEAPHQSYGSGEAVKPSECGE